MIINNPEQNLTLNFYKQGYEQLSGILNKITIGIIVVDKEGRVCCSNAVADALFCPGGKELKGTLFGMPLTNGGSFEIDIISPALGLGIGEIRTDATTWNGEEATLLTIQDVTNMKRAQQEQAELREQLFHIQKLDSVGRLAGGIAHDFNNVLMAITGYASLIQMELRGDESIRQYVEKIITSSGKAASLTQSLLAFSRRQPVSLEPVGLNKIITNMEHLLFRLLGETIECKILLADKDLIIMADSGKIEQVVMNLVTNARDAMPQGGRLTVRTEMVVINSVRAQELSLACAGRYALLTVSDTGIGMDEATKKKIFEPFFTTKERGKGTGIGLAMVYGTVKQHNGHIGVTSRPNQGTTFDVYLPITDEAANNVTKMTDTAKTPGEASTSALTVKTILLAEDEAAVRDSVVKILEHEEYRVISAGNGEDAIIRFRENVNDIDLLVFDVMMPGKNGKEAYNEIKKIKPGVKAIFMSGYSEDTVTNREIQEEGLLFLQKPVAASKLLDKIREILARPLAATKSEIRNPNIER